MNIFRRQYCCSQIPEAIRAFTVERVHTYAFYCKNVLSRMLLKIFTIVTGKGKRPI